MGKKVPLKNVVKVAVTFYDGWADQLDLIAREVFQGCYQKCVEELVKTQIFQMIQQARAKLEESKRLTQEVPNNVELAQNKTPGVSETANTNAPDAVLGAGQPTEQPKNDGISAEREPSSNS